ncbi:group I truncated hemoglobin [Massilibacterium senegalense]|uniref:group I truncated hemoglobin n=1 Tax=Massilibacterium senegalense TaxID=1632858 RepID=UPI000780CFA2|nr:group 1 truncated hemoglobin [Massilibacterium senegalense]
MAQTSELYERLGGKEGIKKVVDLFYDRVLADERVNDYFKNTDMEKQRRHQTLFITFAVGGPNQYTGASMQKAHEGMGLQDIHFDAIVEHLAFSLQHFGVPKEDIQTIANKLEPMRKEIVEK